MSEPTIDAPDVSTGLVTAVVQDVDDGAVLMVAHMNEDAYRRTLDTRRAWFLSRSRAQLWQKGETSGNFLDVESVTIDCDGDAVLLRVHPHGAACHTGARSCFHNPAAQTCPCELQPWPASLCTETVYSCGAREDPRCHNRRQRLRRRHRRPTAPASPAGRGRARHLAQLCRPAFERGDPRD